MGLVPPLRVGILGCASVATYGLLDLRAALPEIDVCALAARDPERARAFAHAHGVRTAHAHYAALIADPNVEVVYNALPNGLHAHWSIAALQAGKAVVCEKPLAANVVEGERMVAAAAAAGQPLIEAFHYLYHPVARRALEIAGSGMLGALREAEAVFEVAVDSVGPGDIRRSFALAGGTLMDSGCYCVDFLRRLIGGEPRVVSARALCAPAQVDVNMRAELAFPGGVRARLAAALDAARIRMFLRLAGERGVLEIDNPFLPHWGHELR
ncbi:MAG: Gfo/Idh/MocA family protein, partial [Gammaproteobacteria bacterium]